MPALIRISGPRLGYRPEMLGAALTTAADAAADERVGADPVDVDVVDDGDVAGAQPLGEVLRAAVQPDGAAHSGARRPQPGRAEGCRCAWPPCFHAAADRRSVRRASATHQLRTVSDTTGGTTRGDRRVLSVALDRYRVVTSVAAVTGVAHALPRTASVPAPSPEVPAATERAGRPHDQGGSLRPARSRGPGVRAPARAGVAAPAVAAPALTARRSRPHAPAGRPPTSPDRSRSGPAGAAPPGDPGEHRRRRRRAVRRARLRRGQRDGDRPPRGRGREDGVQPLPGQGGPGLRRRPADAGGPARRRSPAPGGRVGVGRRRELRRRRGQPAGLPGGRRPASPRWRGSSAGAARCRCASGRSSAS